MSRGGHPGVDDALVELRRDGTLRGAHHVEVGANGRSGSADDRWTELVTEVRDRRIELVVLHHYHNDWLPDPRPLVTAVRASEHRPVVALSCGDPFVNGYLLRPSHPHVFRATCPTVDLVVTTSMGASADAIVRYGAPRVALWPLAADPGRFAGSVRADRPRPEVDVVFVGSDNRSRNPGRGFFWFGRQRARLVEQLTARFGDRFAVYGNGWDGLPSARGPIAFDEQLEVCRRSRVVVGGVPFSRARYYSSNRAFIQILAGVPFVDVRVDGIERLLRDGEHWHLVDHADQVADRCEELLERSDGERDELGRLAAEHVLGHHTELSRWRGLIATLAELRDAGLTGRAPAPPDLRFLLPEVDRATELPQATRGW